MSENCFHIKFFMHSTLMLSFRCQSFIWWFTLVIVTVSLQILTCYNWLAYNWITCLLQSDLFSQFCWSWSLIMHLNWPRKQYKVFLETHSAICCSYCRVLQRVAAFPTIPAIITDAVCLLGAALFILCVNWRLISSLSVFLSLSLTSSSALPPVTATRRPWIFSDQDSISSRCEAALRPGAPRKHPPTPTHTRARPGAEHWALSAAATLRTPSGQSGDLRVHSGRAGLQARRPACEPICVGSEVTARPGRSRGAKSCMPAARNSGNPL